MNLPLGRQLGNKFSKFSDETREKSARIVSGVRFMRHKFNKLHEKLRGKYLPSLRAVAKTLGKLHYSTKRSTCGQAASGGRPVIP